MDGGPVTLLDPALVAAVALTGRLRRATGPGDARSLDQRRADAAVEIAMAGLAAPGLPAAHGRKPVINVTLAASTLTGADGQPGPVNGHPVPAPVARHWARHPHATWRYWAVDATGQIRDTDPASPAGGWSPAPTPHPADRPARKRPGPVLHLGPAAAAPPARPRSTTPPPNPPQTRTTNHPHRSDGAGCEAAVPSRG